MHKENFGGIFWLMGVTSLFFNDALPLFGVISHHVVKLNLEQAVIIFLGHIFVSARSPPFRASVLTEPGFVDLAA